MAAPAAVRGLWLVEQRPKLLGTPNHSLRRPLGSEIPRQQKGVDSVPMGWRGLQKRRWDTRHEIVFKCFPLGFRLLILVETLTLD